MENFGKILVTGSQGFIAQRFLLNTNLNFARVYQLDRLADSFQDKLRIDLRDKNLEHLLPDDVDIVLHCAAALPSYSSEEIFQTDVRATARLLHWARKNRVKRFIHVSSTAVYGPNHLPNITENHSPRKWDAYNTAKIRSEELLPLILGYSNEVSWTILRPKATIGPGRLGLFSYLFDFSANGKRFPIIGSGDAVYQFLHVDDMVSAIELAIKNINQANGQVFNIASIAEHSIGFLFQSILDSANFGKKVLNVPENLARPILKTTNILGVSQVYSRLVENLTNGSTVSIEQARNIIGFQPQYNGLEALKQSFNWYLDNIHQKQDWVYGKGHRNVWRDPLVGFVKSIM